jgi:hypothetical protein
MQMHFEPQLIIFDGDLVVPVAPCRRWRSSWWYAGMARLLVVHGGTRQGERKAVRKVQINMIM